MSSKKKWYYEMKGEKTKGKTITHLGHIMCVGWFPIGKTVVTIWVVVCCCGTNGLDGGTPPVADFQNTNVSNYINNEMKLF